MGKNGTKGSPRRLRHLDRQEKNKSKAKKVDAKRMINTRMRRVSGPR